MTELQITFETLDDCSGVQSGYAAKLLSLTKVKTLGPRHRPIGAFVIGCECERRAQPCG
jgi:hypothetical protein